MTQQYPGPQNPGQPPYPPQQWPQPPKKKSRGKTVGIGCLGFVVVFIIIAVAANAGKGSNSSNASSSSVKQSAPSSATSDSSGGDSSNTSDSSSGGSSGGDSPNASDVDKFRSCVASSGTATEKAAVDHVTKVQSNVMGADVYTDYSGGMMGPDQGNGKLIASAYGSCNKSDGGTNLVTVYDKDGQILSNGNY